MNDTGFAGLHFQSHVFQPAFQDAFGLFDPFAGSIEQSGSQGTLLPLGPLRTGLVPLKTSGSSTSRTPRLLVLFLPCLVRYALFFCQQISVVVLLAVTHGTFSHGMNMLMTE